MSDLKSGMRTKADVGLGDRYLYESQRRCPILIPTPSKVAISSSATVERSLQTSTLPRRVHCVDDEIIEWLKRREQLGGRRLACSWQSAYKHLP
jgi:hypothetical protein